MGLILRRIVLENFRKFREKHEISGLNDGLNVIIEPNETGKSTIMEAVRAAFFLRHGSKSQIIQSFQPFGDTVAPEVEVEFEIDGERYELQKRFLSRSAVTLNGPDGRQQGDAAEDALQSLLGFDKQSSKLEAEALGALGLLWVPQAQGFIPVAPGERVKEGIGGALQDQAGSILGSAGFDTVLQRVENELARFQTRTGRPTGEMKEAHGRVETAQAALTDAKQREADLDHAFDELKRKRGELRLVHEELANEDETEKRTKLAQDLDVAKGAAHKLETEQLKHTSIGARVTTLQSLADRFSNASQRVSDEQEKLKEVQADHARERDNLKEAQQLALKKEESLQKSQELRKRKQEALEEGRDAQKRHDDRAKIAAIRLRYTRLLQLENDQTALRVKVALAVDQDVLDELESVQADMAKEQSVLDSGGVKLKYEGSSDLTLDGAPLQAEAIVTDEAVVGLGSAGQLRIFPPSNQASTQLCLKGLRARQRSLLDENNAASLAELRTRDRSARDAQVELSSLEKQSATLTPADEGLGLGAGPEALKLFCASLPEEDESRADNASVPLKKLLDEYQSSETELAKVDEHQKAAAKALQAAELEETKRASTVAQLQSGLQSAQRECDEIKSQPEFFDLAANLEAAQQELARSTAGLEQATQNAEAFNVQSLEKQIATFDRHKGATLDRKNKLELEIAGLETRIEIAGGEGLGERAAAAQDELDAATETVKRIEDDAATLSMLRDALLEAREHISRSLIGPVAKRAMRYTQQILPGSEPVFGSDFGLQTIRRAGTDETVDMLSHGTQEQLSLLSRLAFAELLLEQGLPVSLILDDPLVYSDDFRLDAMISLLAEAAENMQIVVLTCRERAFRAAPGHRLDIIDL